MVREVVEYCWDLVEVRSERPLVIFRAKAQERLSMIGGITWRCSEVQDDSNGEG